MTYRVYGIALGVFFALGLVLSCGDDEMANPIPANQVTNPADEDQIKGFLSYVFADFEKIDNDDDLPDKDTDLVLLYKDFREKEEYNNRELKVYTLLLVGEEVLLNHAEYPRLRSYDYKKGRNSTLDKLIMESDIEETTCEPYMYKQENRVACAVKVESSRGVLTFVAGFHHDDKNADFFSLPELCGNITLENPAETVKDEVSLKAYVQDVIRETQELVEVIVLEIIRDEGKTPPLSREEALALRMKLGQQLTEQLNRIDACFGTGDLKSESGDIYTFIMRRNKEGTVFLNGNDPGLNGLDLTVTDLELPGDDRKISTLFRNALTCGSGGDPEIGNSATVYYRWDKPSDPDDGMHDTTVEGTIPGISDKIGYIEVADLNESASMSAGGGFPPSIFIFGSGIYKDHPANTPPRRYDCAGE